ncbi:MAG: FKBP-type peptidyl-prolyl cis-trans isomerase [Proteobacteria bacterium]|nr:FKBP-type peptidyl-prolyl cis-trans isomerase [Pseudomonadota bacterium]
MRARSRSRLAPAAILLLVGVASRAPAQDAPATDDEKAFYLLGVIQGRQLNSQFYMTPEELEMVSRGFEDSILDRAVEVEEDEYRGRLQEIAAERQAAVAADEKVASAVYLKEAAAAEGAVRTESGLVITQVVEGTGASPGATDTVRVHYHGTMRDGKVFDSSVERGKPAEFALNRVIPCWTEALQLMKMGGKSRIVCPSEIAYRERGAPPSIPGNAALTFEVELLEIVGN